MTEPLEAQGFRVSAVAETTTPGLGSHSSAQFGSTMPPLVAAPAGRPATHRARALKAVSSYPTTEVPQ
jgi:hypothetical protein